MATAPTPAHVAKLILDCYKDHGARAGHTLA